MENTMVVWPQGTSLVVEGEHAFELAMIKGNQIQDDWFDFDAVNVDVYVDAAVTMAGEECGVHGVAGQVDVLGSGTVIIIKVGHVTSLAAWFDSMMKKDWGVGLGIASLAKIDYVHTCASQP